MRETGQAEEEEGWLGVTEDLESGLSQCLKSRPMSSSKAAAEGTIGEA
jgi:hypothetical protein